MADSREEILFRLQKKQQLMKIRGTNVFRRSYYLDMKRNLLVFDSSKFSCTSGGNGNILPISEITEIRAGWQTDTFNKMARSIGGEDPRGIFRAEHSFSIIYGDGMNETLDLVATCQEQRDDWVQGLQMLIQTESETPFDDWLMDMFYEVDVNRSGALDFDECCNLLTKMKIEIDKNTALILFQNANERDDHGEVNALDPREFVSFYHMLIEVPEICKLLYEKYSAGKNRMHLSELKEFLHEEQNLKHVDDKTISRLLQHNEKSFLKNSEFMSLDGFSRMLQSQVFSVYNDYHQNTVHQDMDQPLSHYYISSSHNTYLTGDQVTSSSSIEGYINALNKGCKLVEMDLHDDPDDKEIYITHGKTLTSKIYLKDVLEDAIVPHAFEVSPYPLIISVENHLSAQGQRKMVQLMKDILKDQLLLTTDHEFDRLPSPNELKNKIIIKAKRSKGLHVKLDSEDSEEDSSNEQQEGKRYSSLKPKKIKHFAPELNEVVNICEGVKFVNINASLKESKVSHFPSIRESKAQNLLKSNPANLVELTKKQIVKVYPQGRRVTSSNIKPYPFWATGVQVVALNMQTMEDKANFYNDGLFRSNGNCGYVLKPSMLLTGIYDPLSFDATVSEMRMTIKVISGQNLVKRPDVCKVNPYVDVKIRGHSQDKQKFRTKTVDKNGLNPIWNECFEIVLKVSPVSIVYFKVQDETRLQNNLLARVCIPFNSLTTGYRTLHLLDKKGKTMHFASLFLHITVSD